MSTWVGAGKRCFFLLLLSPTFLVLFLESEKRRDSGKDGTVKRSGRWRKKKKREKECKRLWSKKRVRNKVQ